MRPDTARPRTWLLAAAAAWAIAAWVLALAGMGGRLAAPADEAAVLRPVPALPKVQASRLGPIGQYTGIAARPLFTTDRRPKPFYLQPTGNEGQAAAFDYVLTSVLITPTLRMAMLQNPDGTQSLRIKLGEAPDTHPAWRLVALNERSAVFAGPEGEKNMDLRVYDGRGGQPPTALAAPNRPPPPPAPGVRPPPLREDNERPGLQGLVEDTPRPVAPPVAATPAPAAASDAANPSTASASPEQAQMEAIRRRIEARRAQLRQQQAQQGQAQPTPPTR